MAVNVKIQVYRGLLANLASLASTGAAGVLAYTTDSQELFMDQGSGTAGYGNPGSGKAWIRVAAGNQVFTAASQSAQTSLAGVMIGDLCTRTDNNTTYMLTVYPSSTFANWTAVAITALTAIPESSVTNLTTDLAATEKTANKNAASGYAGLSAGSKITASQMSAVLASSDLTNDAALEKVANKGVASGYASLDAATKIPVAQLPAAIDCGTF